MVEYDHKPFESIFGSHNLQPQYIYRDNFQKNDKLMFVCYALIRNDRNDIVLSTDENGFTSIHKSS